MKTKAAILVETKMPIEVDEITIPSLKPGQVLVEVKFSGVCHTQVLEVMGHRGKDPFLPHCLGHEGSGVVREIGPQVSKVQVDDHVILSWIKGSGMNVFNTIYHRNNEKINAGAITTFSKYAVISENRLTPISKDFPLKEAALIGCAIPTGLGVIFNTIKPSPGQSIAIFGCGGVGLTALQGAKIAGCIPIIAVDINKEKLAKAKQLGATLCIDASNEDPVAIIKKEGLLDYAVEASGNPIAMEQSFSCVRNQTGCAVIIGNAHEGKLLNLNPKQLNAGKKLFGTWGGDNVPEVHYPRYCNLVMHKCLNLDHFLSRIYGLDDINSAISDLINGTAIRPIIDMSL